MTQEGLGHALQCRMAQRMQRATTPNASDPLAVGHVQVEVSATPTGFMVLIQSPYADEAREILRRANSLVAKSSAQTRVEVGQDQSSNHSL